MSRNIVVEKLRACPLEKQAIEIVERKGIGHPDSIADGLSESVSRALCKKYQKRFGRILHHNTDETQIVGGQSAPAFGGGIVLEPAYILLVGRAVDEVNRQRMPIRATAIKAARGYLEKYFPHLDLESDVMLDCRIGKGSVDLRNVYDTKKHLANDTSFGVGFAPFSETETIVYEAENYINNQLKKKLKAIGRDVKVMANRRKDKINLTVACAIIDQHVKDKDEYVNLMQEMASNTYDLALKHTKRDLAVHVNTADNYKKNQFYLTVTGLSMENGDDGSVGRGNRANGLITPFRPMSMEASAGKNPVTHVGKLYNILSILIAKDIYKDCKGDAEEVYVRLLSQIGKPIDRPQRTSLQLLPAKGVKMSKIRSTAKGVADQWLADIEKVTDLVVNEKVTVF